MAAAFAAPAYAATVDVRVEGDAQTLVQSQVTPSGAPVGKGANPTCAGGSALDALNVATGGNWDGPYYDGLGYAPEPIAGETHAFAAGSYWSFWLNDAYSSAGVCDVQVQQGDELLFFPDCATTGLHAGVTAPRDRRARDGPARPDGDRQGRAAHGAGLPGDRDDVRAGGRRHGQRSAPSRRRRAPTAPRR